MQRNTVCFVDYNNRLSEVRNRMLNQELSAVLVWSLPFGTHGLLSAPNDIGYLTNWPLRHPGMGPAVLVIPAEQEPTIIVGGPEGGAIKGGHLSHFPVKHADPDELASEAKKQLSTETDKFDTLGVSRLSDIPYAFANDLNEVFGENEIVDARHIFADLKVTKDENEISRLKDSAEVADAMFETLSENMRSGYQYSSLMVDMQHTARKMGAQFATTWLSAGPRGGSGMWMEPHRADGEFKHGDMFCTGVQLIYNDYWAHSIRMGTIGDPTDEQREIYDATIEAQEAILEHAEPGVEVSEVSEAFESVYNKYGYESSSRSMHGLGLRYGGPPQVPRDKKQREEGELPVSGSEYSQSELSRKLKEGMVFEAHPNVSKGPSDDLKGMIGDMVLVTEDGAEIITKFPRELLVF